MIIPTLSEIYGSIIQDLEQELGVSSVVNKRFTKVFASVQAAKMKLIYILASKMYKNMWIDTAESEANGGTLERFGRVKIGRDKKVATQGVYTATVNGTIDSIVNAGTTFADKNNNLFILDIAKTLTATSDTISVRALKGGKDFELIVTDKLTATSPISNVDSEITITAVTTFPINAETVEQYREQVIESFRIEPTGGSASDYYTWVKGVVGLRKIYPRTGATAGNIDIFIESNEGVASAGLITSVKTIVDAKKPLSAWNVVYTSISEENVNVQITGLNISTTEEKTKIETAIKAYIRDIRPFVGGVISPARVNDTLRNVGLSSVINSAMADNNFFESVEIKINGSVITAKRYDSSIVPKLNVTTYV